MFHQIFFACYRNKLWGTLVTVTHTHIEKMPNHSHRIPPLYSLVLGSAWSGVCRQLSAEIRFPVIKPNFVRHKCSNSITIDNYVIICLADLSILKSTHGHWDTAVV